MKYLCKILSIILFLNLLLIQVLYSQYKNENILIVNKTNDFEITGKGVSKNWSKTNWLEINPLNKSKEEVELSTYVKVLYSETGIYFLFHCEDKFLNASMDSDFMELWKEDVVEVFLKPDDNLPFYFEYELSPLNYELLLFISDKMGFKTRWQPFDYEKKWQTLHMTSIKGGEKESGAKITEWIAEFFIPYEYLQPFNHVPPISGARWKANIYRVDYDQDRTSYAWQSVDKSFHEYEKFGVLLFE
ncbi:MAG: carbohydrate-binding family 9-like protein [Balneolaceae bacterium]